MLRFTTQKTKLDVTDDQTSTTVLLDLESTYLMQMVPGVSTITFYEGKGAEQMKYFEDRLIEIVRLNPWLEGRIVKVGDRVFASQTLSRSFTSKDTGIST